ncbi:MAG: hypothetical protein L0Y66_07495 [Myxococcaceae bacterium]|nr:hypothetical protein [Myxococcaceae bacterium]MCI0670327.1 hypothetical protein [Myxococcaceae bacterium]
MTSLLLVAQVTADAAARVGEGRIQGGWGYVAASYAIAYGAMAAYAVSLWLRRPRGGKSEE